MNIRMLRRSSFIVGICIAIMLSACSSSKKTTTQTITSTISESDKSALVGVRSDIAIGTTASSLIAKKMSANKLSLQSILTDASLDDATDVNDLQAIKITFSNSILFSTNSSTLSSTAKTTLTSFAQLLENELIDTNLTIFGHTDNTGSHDANQHVSEARATAVAKFLLTEGIDTLRITTCGLSYDDPIAENYTSEGRAQNRRVEIYISAAASMLQKAEAGEL